MNWFFNRQYQVPLLDLIGLSCRSWLERQQNCPTCRAAVEAAPDQASTQAPNAARPGGQPNVRPAGAAGPQDVPRPAPAPGPQPADLPPGAAAARQQPPPRDYSRFGLPQQPREAQTAPSDRPVSGQQQQAGPSISSQTMPPTVLSQVPLNHRLLWTYPPPSPTTLETGRTSPLGDFAKLTSVAFLYISGQGGNQTSICANLMCKFETLLALDGGRPTIHTELQVLIPRAVLKFCPAGTAACKCCFQFPPACCIPAWRICAATSLQHSRSARSFFSAFQHSYLFTFWDPYLTM